MIVIILLCIIWVTTLVFSILSYKHIKVISDHVKFLRQMEEFLAGKGSDPLG